MRWRSEALPSRSSTCKHRTANRPLSRRQGFDLTGAVACRLGGGDIEATVIDGIEHCETFIVFGSQSYGEDTGNTARTYYESKFALDRKKRIILIRASRLLDMQLVLLSMMKD